MNAMNEMPAPLVFTDAAAAKEVDLLMASGVFANDSLQRWLEAAPASAQYSRLLTVGAVLRRVDDARRTSERAAPPYAMEDAREK